MGYIRNMEYSKNHILQSFMPVIHLINMNLKLMIDVEKFTKDLSRQETK